MTQTTEQTVDSLVEASRRFNVVMSRAAWHIGWDSAIRAAIDYGRLTGRRQRVRRGPSFWWIVESHEGELSLPTIASARADFDRIEAAR